MEGVSATYFQIDQFGAEDAGLPVLFQDVCVSSYLVSKQMVSSTRYHVVVGVQSTSQSASERSGMMLLFITSSIASCLLL